MGYWSFFILLMFAGMIVQFMLKSRFEKYSKVSLRSDMSGAEIAMKMMHDNGIYDVKVECIEGQLTDHYNPATKTVNLSKSVYMAVLWLQLPWLPMSVATSSSILSAMLL